jgi:hypothetical protein
VFRDRYRLPCRLLEAITHHHRREASVDTNGWLVKMNELAGRAASISSVSTCRSADRVGDLVLGDR